MNLRTCFRCCTSLAVQALPLHELLCTELRYSRGLAAAVGPACGSNGCAACLQSTGGSRTRQGALPCMMGQPRFSSRRCVAVAALIRARQQ